MSTPHPSWVPPKGQVKKTSQENQSLFLSCCQLGLSCILTAKLVAQGQPGMPPSGLKAELMPICGAGRPPPRQQESNMPGPAMDAVQSAWSRSRHAEQREFGGQPFRGPALCKELRVPVAARCYVTQTSHRLPAHLVMSTMGHQVAKASIYTLAGIITHQAEMTDWKTRLPDHFKRPWLHSIYISAVSREELPGVLEGGSGTVSPKELSLASGPRLLTWHSPVPPPSLPERLMKDRPSVARGGH